MRPFSGTFIVIMSFYLFGQAGKRNYLVLNAGFCTSRLNFYIQYEAQVSMIQIIDPIALVLD